MLAIYLIVSRRRKKKMDGLVYHYDGNNYFVTSSQFSGSSHPPSGMVINSGGFTHGQPVSALTDSGSGYYQSGPYSGGEGGAPVGSKSRFSYEELTGITSNFSRDNVIGEGGFGCVYKGWLSDGKCVAVKQLKAGSGQGEREFQAELIMESLANITKMFRSHLGKIGHPRIIHRDIKSANILLDYSWEAQVADFGLAKLANDAHTHVSTRIMGTFGYLAPEYASSGKLTDRSDVFSFGVVLLELITGRKPVDQTRPLEGAYNRNEMMTMVEAAAACVRHSAPKRPRMVQVMRALDEGSMTDLSNGIKVGQSQVFGGGGGGDAAAAAIQQLRRTAFASEEFTGEFEHSSANSESRPMNRIPE
uniref:non-specific serine/threonine protein kinase n=1 Tax=Leersia perrieri TaxID=77586 RepID=A0A0D9WQ36_9ORYZ